MFVCIRVREREKEIKRERVEGRMKERDRLWNERRRNADEGLGK